MSPEPRDKIIVVLIDGALPDTVDSIEAALIERDQSIVQWNGALYIKSSESNVRATAERLRLHTMRVADFVKYVKRPRPGFVAVDPALKYFEALRRKREWKFPSLSLETNRGKK